MTHKDQIYRAISRDIPIPMEFFYNSDIGAIRWKHLCESVEYPAYTRSIQFIQKKSTNIFNIIGKDFFNNPLDIISLGPGNGIKDGYFLKSLLGYTKQEAISCLLVDISMKMLHIAAHNLKTDKRFRKIAKKVKIEYIHSLFDDLYISAKEIKKSNSSKIYLLLGNTLGNTSQEIIFLNQINAALQ
jgi:uncharacterized SAM-dependent methyltransferase